MARITQDILDQWREKNDDGYGYGFPDCDHTWTPAEAAEDAGWTILEHGVEGTVLCRKPDGQLALVCDANGPWVVDVEEDDSAYLDYHATIDGGQGGTKTFSAENATEALAEAIEWAKAGDWSYPTAFRVRVVNQDDDADSAEELVEIDE